MSELARFGVSIEADLLKEFDHLIKSEGYPTRSEAIKRLIKGLLVKERWQKSEHEVAGVMTFLYDHHRRELVNKMIHIQHDFGHIIISSQHIHLDHNNCLEMAVVKGKATEIQTLMQKVRRVKGLKHSDLIMTATE